MKEHDIRPKELFEELIRLAQEDVADFFSKETPRRAIECPACGDRGKEAFEKNGFKFEECPTCYTLYVSPRPIAEAFDKYYVESRSSKFWATDFYRQTVDARREKLWKPKARLIKEIVDRLGLGAAPVYDIGGGYGVFAEEMQQLGLPTTVIEPAPHLAQVCRAKGLATIEAFLEDVDPAAIESRRKAFVSFELFEHLHDPAAFLYSVRSILGLEDLFIFTTLSGAGVDIQVLWQDSKAVMPPYHLNFFNPLSIRRLLEATGFEVLEIRTPGKLDIDILDNNRALIKDRFWRTFVACATDAQKTAMQTAIANDGWSSHMMVTCRKSVQKAHDA